MELVEGSEEECAFLSEGFVPGQLYFIRGTTFASSHLPRRPFVLLIKNSLLPFSVLVPFLFFIFVFLFSFLCFCCYHTHTHHGETSEPQPAGGNVPSANSEVVLRLGRVSAQCASFGGNGSKGTVPGKIDALDLLFDSL